MLLATLKATRYDNNGNNDTEGALFQDAKFKEVVVPALENYGRIFEQILKENGTGWLVGEKVSHAAYTE